MSSTDKDDPWWVKATQDGESYKVFHHWGCEEAAYGGEQACDLPAAPPTEHGPEGTWCRWIYWPESVHQYDKVFGSMPAHGCSHPRCTHCTAKLTHKRKRRRGEARELAKIIAEEL